MTLNIMAQRCYVVSFMLIVTYAECHFQAFYAECHSAGCRGANELAIRQEFARIEQCILDTNAGKQLS